MSKRKKSPEKFRHHFTDEERLAIVDGILFLGDEGICESLAELLISLRGALMKPDGEIIVANELDELIREVFKNSPAFELAVDLYGNRFNLTGETRLEKVLAEYRAKHLRRPRERKVQA